MQSLTREIAGVWIILVLISLPFPFDLFPRIGEFISDVLFPINQWVLGLFSYEIVKTYSSDSVIYYVQSLLLIIPAILIALLLLKFRKEPSAKSITTIITFLTAFFLFKYGIIKVLQEQFYTVEPNIAYTPVGMLNKDILFWASMGTSQGYNLFMGITEILAAILLIPKRTRLLGSLIAVGIFTHVFVINLSFDITVKLLSGVLLINSLYILSAYKKTLLYTFFHLGAPEINKQQADNNYSNASTISVVVLILLESFYPYTQSHLPHELSGSYLITSNESAHFKTVKRIHFHSQGFLITESYDQLFDDYKYVELSNKNTISIPKLKMEIKLQNKSLYIRTNDVTDTIQIKKLQNEYLPINQDGFHWTVEGMINDQ